MRDCTKERLAFSLRPRDIWLRDKDFKVLLMRRRDIEILRRSDVSYKNYQRNRDLQTFLGLQKKNRDSETALWKKSRLRGTRSLWKNETATPLHSMRILRDSPILNSNAEYLVSKCKKVKNKILSNRASARVLFIVIYCTFWSAFFRILIDSIDIRFVWKVHPDKNWIRVTKLPST